MGGGRKNKNVVFFSGYVCRRTSSFRDDVRHISGGPQFVTRPVYRRTMKYMRTCTTLHTSDPSFAAIFMCTLDLCSQGLPLTRYLCVRCVFFFSLSLFSLLFLFIIYVYSAFFPFCSLDAGIQPVGSLSPKSPVAPGVSSPFRSPRSSPASPDEPPCNLTVDTPSIPAALLSSPDVSSSFASTSSSG